MSKVLKVIKQALKDENVMGFDGLHAFDHIKKHLKKKKLVGDGPHPVQVLRTKVDKKEYACALFGDQPDDVWGVVHLKPHKDAYIGDTFKLRWVGHVTGLTEEMLNG